MRKCGLLMLSWTDLNRSCTLVLFALQPFIRYLLRPPMTTCVTQSSPHYPFSLLIGSSSNFNLDILLLISFLRNKLYLQCCCLCWLSTVQLVILTIMHTVCFIKPHKCQYIQGSKKLPTAIANDTCSWQF